MNISTARLHQAYRATNPHPYVGARYWRVVKPVVAGQQGREGATSKASSMQLLPWSGTGVATAGICSTKDISDDEPILGADRRHSSASSVAKSSSQRRERMPPCKRLKSLGRRLHAPRECHGNLLKAFMRHFKGAADLVLTMTCDEDIYTICAKSSTDMAGCTETHKFNVLQDRCLVWKCELGSRQSPTTIATSAPASEYDGACAACAEALYAQHLVS